jgi:hypothetical protein
MGKLKQALETWKRGLLLGFVIGLFALSCALCSGLAMLPVFFIAEAMGNSINEEVWIWALAPIVAPFVAGTSIPGLRDFLVDLK